MKKRLRENRYQRYNRSVKGRYRRLIESAKKRKLSVSLLMADYGRILKEKCHYCSGYFKDKRGGHGLDRINNRQGYHKYNVLRCCPTCNIIRNDVMSVDEAKLVITTLIAFREASE